MKHVKPVLATSVAMAALLAVSPLVAETYRQTADMRPETQGAQRDARQDQQTRESGQQSQDEMAEETRDAEDLLVEASETIQKLRQDEDAQQALQQAKGIFVVPDFGRAALVAGISGGQGIVLTRTEGKWGNPAFYNIGSISLGAQAGIAAGQIAMLLMTDEAVASFRQENNFSLGAEAGLTIIDWSEAAQASWGKGDIVLWTDTEGAFIGAELAISDIFSDDEANNAYYQQDVTVAEILSGDVRNPREDVMSQALR